MGEIKTMADKVTLLATGDILIDRDKPETVFAYTASKLNQADVIFGQLEQMLSDKGCISATTPHGACYSSPKLVPALTYGGYTILSLAGNHTLDLGYEALLDTMERLQKANIAMVGVGKGIEEARKPTIVEVKGTRIAFLAYNSIGPDGYEAGIERPGCAPMRIRTIYEQMDYQPGTPCRIVTIPKRDDLDALVADVSKAKSQADIVIMSIHWGIHNVPAEIAMYERDVAKAAIDAGVDLILGHHPHILKGIDVYKGKVIFHSLGNFVMEIKPGRLSKHYVENVWGKLYTYERDPEYPTYPFHPEAKRTMVAKCIINNKKIERVAYLPAYINKKAEPEFVTRDDPRSEEVFKYVIDISQREGLRAVFSQEGDEVIIEG